MAFITLRLKAPQMFGTLRVSAARISTGNIKEKEIEKSVFISQSHDIFSNLAFEDWMYKKWDFSRHHVMLLWRNDPCVVIGRHQNPWAEADTSVLENEGVALARRNSGGGAVYHDKGNLNITFFTPRERYDRYQNLRLIADTLRSQWGLNAEINDRHDIILDAKYKVSQVSGTASKLGRPNSYHHCTLLVNVNKEALKSTLHHNKGKSLETNATASVRSDVVNLEEAASGGLDMQSLMTALGWAYLASCPLSHRDGGWDQVSTTRGFQLVSPTDDWFPGLGAVKEELQSWDWVYGKTPKFEVRRDVGRDLVVTLGVEAGVVKGVTLSGPSLPPVATATTLVGRQFTPALLDSLVKQVESQAPAILATATSKATPTKIHATA